MRQRWVRKFVPRNFQNKSVKIFARKGPERPERPERPKRPEGPRQGSKVPFWSGFVFEMSCASETSERVRSENSVGIVYHPTWLKECQRLPQIPKNRVSTSTYISLLLIFKDKLQDPLACHWYVIVVTRKLTPLFARDYISNPYFGLAERQTWITYLEDKLAIQGNVAQGSIENSAWKHLESAQMIPLGHIFICFIFAVHPDADDTVPYTKLRPDGSHEDHLLLPGHSRRVGVFSFQRISRILPTSIRGRRPRKVRIRGRRRVKVHTYNRFLDIHIIDFFNAFMVAGVVGHYRLVEFWSQKS